MSPKSTSTPVTKSRLTTKNKRKSGIIKPATIPTGLSVVSSTPSFTGRKVDTVSVSPMFPPPAIPVRNDSVSSSPSYYRNYEAFTSSPFHIPNSQAPIPGKEVYWDYDTPQSRKCREAFEKEFNESDSPVPKNNDVTPKLRMVARTRIESTNSNELARKGEEAMQELLELCREAEEDKEENVGGRGEKVCQLKFENLSMEQEVKEEAEEDMFADDMDFGDSLDLSVGDVMGNKVDADEMNENTEILDNAIDNDFFDDDDESFLLQATQAVEYELVVKKEPEPVQSKVQKTMPSKSVKEEATINRPVKKEPVMTTELKTESKAFHPAISRVQTESDGFGSDDDSFDELLSQMEEPLDVLDTPASPVLKSKRKCFDLTVPSQPHLPLSELNRQLPVIAAQSRQLPVIAAQSRQLPAAAAQSRQLPVPAAQSRQLPVSAAQSRGLPVTAAQSRAAGGSLRKFGSFDSQEHKKTFPRLKSEPNIGTAVNISYNTVSKVQPVTRMVNTVNTVVPPAKAFPTKPVTRSSCTKEDIDKKRKEAMARRQMSQSQVKR